MKISYTSFSEKGGRMNNEDCRSVLNIDDERKMFIVCDGDEKSGIYQMGTTMVMMSIEGQTATIAHTGDSRCYVVDLKGNIKYRTLDHIETGTPWIPYINRAFFTRHPEQAVPEIKQIELEPCDRILLCTDGLYNAIDDETLLHTLQCAKDVEQVAKKYDTICQDKANDNYTAIIVEVE